MVAEGNSGVPKEISDTPQEVILVLILFICSLMLKNTVLAELFST